MIQSRTTEEQKDGMGRRVRDARKEEVGHGPVSVGGGDRSEWTPKGRKGGLPQPHQA